MYFLLRDKCSTDIKKGFWLKMLIFQVGLGTDCSGGYSPSMLNSMRLAVVASNTISFTEDKDKELDEEGGLKLQQEVTTPLNYAEVLYLATRGGASLLHMEDQLGALDRGKFADFLLVDMTGEKVEVEHFICKFCAISF